MEIAEGYEEIVESLRRNGLIEADEVPKLEPLTGGVASDILCVRTQKKTFCLKRALPRLKVAAVWEVPVERNTSEAEWMRTVGKWLPHSVPHLLMEDGELKFFAMDFLPPEQYPVWKNELANGRINHDFAAAVGTALGNIHSRSTKESRLPKIFSHDAIFESIRPEPYLRFTATRHPDLAGRLNELADTVMTTKRALVHGDVSPKNILCGANGPVFLDAECAWWGDPAFDVAFCLNQLLLKGSWHPEWKTRYLESFTALAKAYFSIVDWEDKAGLEQRVAHLLPGLWLGRIDGKSPAEYVTEESERSKVRTAARALLLSPVSRLDDISKHWGTF